MLLKELTTPFETRRVIMYGANHNSVVYHNKLMQQIDGCVYRGVDENDPNRSWTNCRVYAYYSEFNIGIALGDKDVDESVDDVMEACRNSQVVTATDFVCMIEARIAAGYFIGNAEIELIKHISPVLVDKCIIARKRYLETQEQLKRERAERKLVEDQTYVNQKNQEADQAVQDAVQILKNDGRLINNTIEIFRSRYDNSTYSIINYIARLYGAKIPIRTQGWINQSLAEITVENGRMVGGKMLHGKTQSKTIYKYINMLIEAVRNTDSD